MKKKKKKQKRKPWRRPTPKTPDPASHTIEDLLGSTGCWPEQMLIDVGAKLRDGRKCQPLVETEGKSYDECVGVSYSEIDVETCGFRVSATPRRIGVREVAEHACASCRRCHGLGYWVVTRTTAAGVDEAGNKVMQDIGYEQSCSCADKAYQKRFPMILVDSQLGEWIGLDELMIEAATDGHDGVS